MGLIYLCFIFRLISVWAWILFQSVLVNFNRLVEARYFIIARFKCISPFFLSRPKLRHGMSSSTKSSTSFRSSKYTIVPHLVHLKFSSCTVPKILTNLGEVPSNQVTWAIGLVHEPRQVGNISVRMKNYSNEIFSLKLFNPHDTARIFFLLRSISSHVNWVLSSKNRLL